MFPWMHRSPQPVRVAAAHNRDVKPQPCAQDVLAKESRLSCVLDSLRHEVYRQRIFRANIDVAFRGAYGVGSDDHALNNGKMGKMGTVTNGTKISHRPWFF
jgi:hypothetical protein